MQHRIPELDGLRGIAIAMVVLYHFAPTTGALSAIHPILRTGWIGVDLFFVLSGYLITGILLRTRGDAHYYGNFIRNRSLRIFPMYFAYLALVTALVYFQPGRELWKAQMDWGSPAWYAFFLGNVPSAMGGAFPPVQSYIHLWSLQVEEQFYLSYPFLIRKFNIRRIEKILWGVCAAALLLRTGLAICLPGNHWAATALTPCRMDSLGAGALIAVFRHEDALRQHTKALRILLAAAGIVCFALLLWNGEAEPGLVFRAVGYTALAILFSSLLGLLVSGEAGAVQGWLRWLRWAPLVYLGRISYGLYLMHGLAGYTGAAIVSRFLAVEPEGTIHLLICVTAAVIAATLSWSLFESRVLRYRISSAA